MFNDIKLLLQLPPRFPGIVQVECRILELLAEGIVFFSQLPFDSFAVDYKILGLGVSYVQYSTNGICSNFAPSQPSISFADWYV